MELTLATAYTPVVVGSALLAVVSSCVAGAIEASSGEAVAVVCPTIALARSTSPIVILRNGAWL